MNDIPATIRDALHQNQDIEDEDGHKFGSCRLCWGFHHISTRTLVERASEDDKKAIEDRRSDGLGHTFRRILHV